jgi:2-C-methyl-D-erythritol 4-phosphate cytidylyltransferase
MSGTRAGAIVVAAGRSSRLPGPLPKPFLRLGGRSLLAHALHSLQAARSVGGIVVVAGREHVARARRIARGFAKVVAVVPGGARRQDSVACGLEALPEGFDPVLVHDGARPLVSPELIDGTAAAARRHGAALAAAPVADTLKRVRRGKVAGTVDRSELWQAQTPQGFRRAWLEQGLERARQDGVEVTDDAMLVERLGRAVRVVESSSPNLKVTTAADLKVARALLGRRRP